MNDERWMRAALSLAARGLGQVAPNPAVGCVLVKDNRIVGRGWTQPGGRPHAETHAIAQAEALAEGATAYVTLEPCSHHGQTPPCCDALMEAGIARCIVATRDPDPRVNGKGLARLQAAGIDVAEGVCGDAARDLNAGFILRVSEGRPLVTLKLATSLDGKIATASGDSKWITGPEARRYGHLLRAQHDVIVTGVGTVLADDPMLTCRINGLEHRSPDRVVLDTHLRTPLDSVLVRSARQTPFILITSQAAADKSGQAFADKGVQLATASAADGESVAFSDALKVLGSRGYTRAMVEAGSHLAASAIRAGAVDRLAWFRAPLALGGDALDALAGMDLNRVADAEGLVPVERLPLGQDVLETYRRKPY